jgi:hypothetical protein
MNATLVTLNEWETYAAAECAAEVLAKNLPRKGRRAWSAVLHNSAVVTLRTLWEQGDLAARIRIAQCIHISLGTGRSRRFAKATNLGGVTR